MNGNSVTSRAKRGTSSRVVSCSKEKPKDTMGWDDEVETVVKNLLTESGYRVMSWQPVICAPIEPRYYSVR